MRTSRLAPVLAGGAIAALLLVTMVSFGGSAAAQSDDPAETAPGTAVTTVEVITVVDPYNVLIVDGRQYHEMILYDYDYVTITTTDEERADDGGAGDALVDTRSTEPITALAVSDASPAQAAAAGGAAGTTSSSALAAGASASTPLAHTGFGPDTNVAIGLVALGTGSALVGVRRR